jgi:hypothetical protein
MRIALGVSYNGQAYRGWQASPMATPYKTNSKRPWAALLLKKSPPSAPVAPIPVCTG